MTTQAPYRNRLAEAFGLPNAPTLITRTLHKSTMAVTELRCDQPGFGTTAPIPQENAYLIALQFRACLDHDLYFEGRFVKPRNWFPGVVTMYDLRRSPVADIRDPYHSIMFHLPQAGLESFAAECGAPPANELQHDAGAGIDDPVVRHLLSSLLPALGQPSDASSLFLDHVVLALTAHLAHTYGGVVSCGPRRGGLAPHLERRAKERMTANLQEDLSLAGLAAECGLSARHFARAFRQSTGVAPHRWIVEHRMERARNLLASREMSLSDVALACGFADQSHFTRCFAARVGMSPGAWRRMHAAPGRTMAGGRAESPTTDASA